MKTTVVDRARVWFGESNTEGFKAAKCGPRACLLIGTWPDYRSSRTDLKVLFYSEDWPGSRRSPESAVITLTPLQLDNFCRLVDGFRETVA